MGRVKTKWRETKIFKSEKDLCDFIDLNAIDFATKILLIPYHGHKREFQVSGTQNWHIPFKARVDFKFSSPNGDIYVECKNPENECMQNSYHIGQLMAYSCASDYHERKVSRIVLVTTRMDKLILEMIKKFNLPFEVFLFSDKDFFKIEKM